MPGSSAYRPVHKVLQAADIARPVFFTEIPEDDGNLVSHLAASAITIYHNAVPKRLTKANSRLSFHVKGIASPLPFTSLPLASLTLCNNSRSYLSTISIILMPSGALYGICLCHI